MNCMKCGREAVSGNAFCEACLKEMDERPVTPGTVILLPRNTRQSVRKVPPKKPQLSPEEQLAVLQRKVRHLRILAVLLLALVIGLGIVARRAITELDIQRLLGKNYSTVQQTEPSETLPEA